MNEIEERVTELELRFMEQARLLEDLNAVVTEDGRRLDRLVRENSRLREIINRMAPEAIESPDE